MANISDLLDYQIQQDTSICQGQSISFGDSLWSESGVFQTFNVSVLGLDSTITLNLTVHPNISTQVDTSMTVGSVFQGWSVTKDTVFTNHLQSIYQCDSVVTTLVHALINSHVSSLESAINWQVSPNPFGQYLRVQSDDAIIHNLASISLTDLVGRVVWTMEAKINLGENIYFLPKHLSAGTYVLGVTTPSHQQTWLLVRGLD